MEALAIIFVFVVAVGIFVGSWFGTTYGAKNIITELAQLEQYREVLRKKALRGRLERWDDEMMGQIAYQLDEVEARIVRETKP